MNQEYLRMRLSGLVWPGLAWKAGRQDANKDPFGESSSPRRFASAYLPDSANPIPPKGFFAFPGRTPGDTKGLHGLRGYEYTQGADTRRRGPGLLGQVLVRGLRGKRGVSP